VLLVDGHNKIEISRMDVVNLRPDDTIILSFPSETVKGEIQKVVTNLKVFFPLNKIVVLEAGATFAVARPKKGV
jgi:hypothetical protein